MLPSYFYLFIFLDNEYEAAVYFKNKVYGKGTGNSKKEAKLQAAKITLEMLIPELNGKAEEVCGLNVKKSTNTESVLDSNNVSSEFICEFRILYLKRRKCIQTCHVLLQIFDEIKITDPRIAEFCARTTEPSPYSMLLTCLRR